MARIEGLKKVIKERNTVHETVSATFSTFEVDEKKYFQIDTYGTSKREIPDKVSQSIQLDEDGARRLVELLAKEFNMTFRITG